MRLVRWGRGRLKVYGNLSRKKKVCVWGEEGRQKIQRVWGSSGQDPKGQSLRSYIWVMSSVGCPAGDLGETLLGLSWALWASKRPAGR